MYKKLPLKDQSRIIAGNHDVTLHESFYNVPANRIFHRKGKQVCGNRMRCDRLCFCVGSKLTSFFSEGRWTYSGPLERTSCNRVQYRLSAGRGVQIQSA